MKSALSMLSESNIGGKKYQIIRAAEKVILTSGFYACTFDRIIEESGVSRGTVFKYFKSKEKVFETVVNLVADSIETEISQILKTLAIAASTPKDVIHGFLSVFADDSAKEIWVRARIVAATIVELKEHHPDLILRIREGIQRIVDSISDLFAAAGLARKKADLYARQLLSLIIGALLMVRTFGDHGIFRAQILFFRDQVLQDPEVQAASA